MRTSVSRTVPSVRRYRSSLGKRPLSSGTPSRGRSRRRQPKEGRGSFDPRRKTRSGTAKPERSRSPLTAPGRALMNRDRPPPTRRPTIPSGRKARRVRRPPAGVVHRPFGPPGWKPKALAAAVFRPTAADRGPQEIDRERRSNPSFLRISNLSVGNGMFGTSGRSRGETLEPRIRHRRRDRRTVEIRISRPSRKPLSRLSFSISPNGRFESPNVGGGIPNGRRRTPNDRRRTPNGCFESPNIRRPNPNGWRRVARTASQLGTTPRQLASTSPRGRPELSRRNGPWQGSKSGQ